MNNKVFTVTANEPFFPVLVEYILAKYDRLEIAKVKIVVPYKRDTFLLLDTFKKCKLNKTIILPNIISFEDIDREHLISNIDKIKVISPIKRILLLTEFIVKWNRDHQENFPVSLAYNLASLLDDIQCNQISVSALCGLYSTKYWQKTSFFLSEFAKFWSVVHNEEVVDILEHKNNYINNPWQKDNTDNHVVFAGIHHTKICQNLIKAIYNLEFGVVILPNLDLNMREEDWHAASEDHPQYHFKNLLNSIGISRKDVRYLTTEPKISNKLIEYIFDFSRNLSDFDAKENSYANNFEVITCQSQEEEAQVISMIIRSEGFENTSLFISDQLLLKRVNSLLKGYNVNIAADYYLYTTFLLYTIDVLVSNWGSLELLSLLKHPFVDLGYPKDKYNIILANFEIKILRNLYGSGAQEIKKNISSNGYQEISSFFSQIEHSFAPLISAVGCDISNIVNAHVECVNQLSKMNFLELGNEVSDFIITLMQECQKIEIKTIDLYRKILSLLLQNNSSSSGDLHKFSLYKNKVVILTNFNEGSFPPDFQNSLLNPSICRKIGLPSAEEKQSYFKYILHNLFHAEKVYITRSLKGIHGINRKPVLLQRMEMLINKSGCALNKQPFREWLKLLFKADLVIPCSRPKPKPSVEIRSKKLQVFSPTAIEKLIRNPYSFYIEYILNLKHLRELNFRPTILDFGIIVHKILERSGHIGCELLLDIARKELFSHYVHFPNIQSMWWPKLQRIIKNFIILDVERRKNVRTIEVEKSFIWPLSEKMIIKSKCDRVEHMLDDGIAIIDYKTGLLPTQNDIKTGFSPQLILQALTAEYSTNKEVMELMYWKFENHQIKVLSIEDYKETMNFFAANIANFLFRYLDKDIPFTASLGIEKYLGYKHLERTEEWL